MCYLSCHSLLVTTLILLSLVSWTVAVRAALIDPTNMPPSMSVKFQPTFCNRIALRVESFMATLWLSFIGLLTLGAAAACLSFGGTREKDPGVGHSQVIVLPAAGDANGVDGDYRVIIVPTAATGLSPIKRQYTQITSFNWPRQHRRMMN
ncbi:hypothetical protein GE09DRAFT_1289757 [Coniochaeta sp. 2T2.1]|nr:hypothetical protein GE09DRAFT_1289757 [Coniochaeta sp. 2T2.1]